MIKPAILYKEELSKAFNQKLYTQEYLWYEGGIDNYEHEIKEEQDKFQYAIIDNDKVIGFISFRVDWYCSCVFNFGLINFSGQPSMAIFSAIREVIKMIEGFNLHRIDFRCVSGNPAECGYDGIIERFRGKYKLRKVDFKDNIKDRQGKYHDTIMYELIRREEV